jgi:hypothetical protein
MLHELPPQSDRQSALCGHRSGLHSSGHPSPHGPGLHPMLHPLPPQVGSQSALPGQRTGLHRSGQPPPHGPGLHPTLQVLPPQVGSQSALPGQRSALHRSGQPPPHGPGLQPTLHPLPPHRERQRALAGHKIGLHSSGHPALHGLPPVKMLQFCADARPAVTASASSAPAHSRLTIPTNMRDPLPTHNTVRRPRRTFGLREFPHASDGGSLPGLHGASLRPRRRERAVSARNTLGG